MAKGASYDIAPKMKVLPKGTLLKNKTTLYGTNAAGVNEADEKFEFGKTEVVVDAGTCCMFVEDVQFMAAAHNTPMSAWIRLHLIAGEKIIWHTLVCERKRIWDFETFRGKQRKINEELEKHFEILQEGND